MENPLASAYGGPGWSPRTSSLREEIDRLWGRCGVTLGPRRILMAADNPRTQAFYEAAGVECLTVEVGELLKAAGGIGCLSGVLKRE